MDAEQHDLREDIFKGATRPAMVAGVPMVPFVLYSLGVMLLFFWVGWLASFGVSAALVVIAIPGYVWMRLISRHDDQRLLQVLLLVRLKFTNGTRVLWKVRSYTPVAARTATVAFRRR